MLELAVNRMARSIAWMLNPRRAITIHVIIMTPFMMARKLENRATKGRVDDMTGMKNLLVYGRALYQPICKIVNCETRLRCENRIGD